MEEEREIKIEILEDISFPKLKENLSNLFNVEFGEPEEEKDTYYDFENNSLFLKNHAIRIRESSSKNSFAYKALFSIPERKSNPWFVLEHESYLPTDKNFLNSFLSLINLNQSISEDNLNSHQLKIILNSIGLEEKIILKKKRYTADNNGVKIIIDLVDKLGTFVEFELEKGNQTPLSSYLKDLSFKFDEVRFGYTNLYAKRVLGIETPDFKSLYSQNPDWNYLPKQKEIVLNMLKIT